MRGFAVHRCGPCDLEFVFPTPPPEALAKVYNQGYFHGEGSGYTDYFTSGRCLSERKATERLEALASLGVRSGRLLDLGSAAGYFMQAAQDRGFQAYGVEPSAEARAELQGPLASRVCASLDHALAWAPFDLVTLFDSLEHLPDPFATLRELRKMMSPRASVAVVLPVLGNLNTRLFPRSWDQYKPPEHLWFWSRRAMRRTLAQTLGARVLCEDIAWRRDGRFVDPERLSKTQPTKVLSSLDRALGRALHALHPDLVTDSVAFYARL